MVLGCSLSRVAEMPLSFQSFRVFLVPAPDLYPGCSIRFLIFVSDILLFVHGFSFMHDTILSSILQYTCQRAYAIHTYFSIIHNVSCGCRITEQRIIKKCGFPSFTLNTNMYLGCRFAAFRNCCNVLRSVYTERDRVSTAFI